MMIDQHVAYSRPLATAATLAASAADAHRFTNKVVLLTGEEEILGLDNGVFCFLDALRLLMRTVANLEVFVPASLCKLRHDVEELARKIEFGNPVLFLDEQPTLERYDAILNVGWRVAADLPSTTINSNGWIARISSTATPLPYECGQANPIAALAAACLGISDVFKRLIRLRSDVAEVFDGLEFSLYTYETEDVSPGLPLPEHLALPTTLLAGGGAIGNGIALLLSQLNLSGDLWVLDRQEFGEENLGTCVMLGPSGVGMSKSKFLAEEITRTTALSAHPLIGNMESLKRQFGIDVPYPELVLSGFDNVPARHQLQDLWPNLLVDGGISEFGVQAFSHRWGSPHQCLKCHFVAPEVTDHQLVASELTGLSRSRITDPDAPITDEDIAVAPEHKQAWLRERIGQKTCSVISEAALQSLRDTEDSEGFSPSAPFVACMSAALVVARAVASLIEPDRATGSRFTFDILHGPANGFELHEAAKPTCDCTNRAGIINHWRALRNGAVAP